MSLRNNKAAQLNRYMMFGMIALGIIVLGCVFAFLYMSTSKQANPFAPTDDDGQLTDSIVVNIIGDEQLLDSLSINE